MAPFGDALRPARQASVVMFILSGLALLASVTLILGAFVPPDRFPPETRDQLNELLAPVGISIKVFMLTMGMFVAIPCAVLAVLGVMVRGGGIRSIVTSIVVGGLMLAYMLLNVVAALFSAQPASFLFPGLFAAAIVYLITRLVAAARAARMIAGMAAQYQAQYWQYHQFNQEPGYGYVAEGSEPEQGKKV
jgi:magnesium-transporting ATPase (P-type)